MMKEFDHDKYIIIYDEDLIPDTEFTVISDHKGELWLISKNEKQNIDLHDYEFRGVAVTSKYWLEAEKIKNEYEEVKSDCDSIRNSDEQYDDPVEWRLYEEYSKYFTEGLWFSQTYWDYSI